MCQACTLALFKTTCANILEKRNSLLSLICKTLNCNPQPHYIAFVGSFKPVCSMILTYSLLYALFMLVCLIGNRLKPVIPVSPTAQVILLSLAYCKTSFPIYKPFYEFSHLCTPTTPSIFIAFMSDAHKLFTVSSLTVTNKNISLAASQLYKCFHACHLSTTHDKQILEQLSELNNLLSPPYFCIYDSMADPNDIINMYNMNNDDVPNNQQTAENRPDNTLDSEEGDNSDIINFLNAITPELRLDLDNNDVSIQSLSSNYHTQQEIISLSSRDSNKLFISHFNIRSLNKNFDEFRSFINELEFKHSIIGLSETWLKETSPSSNK